MSKKLQKQNEKTTEEKGLVKKEEKGITKPMTKEEIKNLKCLNLEYRKRRYKGMVENDLLNEQI